MFETIKNVMQKRKPASEGKKYSVNIVGSCCSRNLFNYPHLSAMYDVKEYVFQVAIWEMFQESLDIDIEIIRKIAPNNFQARLLDYGLNKTLERALINKKSDYLLIDTQCFVSPVYKVTYQGKECFIQHFRGELLLDKLKNELGKSFYYEKLTIDDIDQERIEKGLERFGDLIKSIYSSKEIILYCPIFVDYRLDENYKVVKLSDSVVSLNKKRNEIINRYYDIIKRQFPEARQLNFLESSIADDYDHIKATYSTHYSNMTYIKQGYSFIEMLNHNNNGLYPYDVSPEEYVMEYYFRNFGKCRKLICELEQVITGNTVVDKFSKLPVSAVLSLEWNDGLLTVDKANSCIDKK